MKKRLLIRGLGLLLLFNAKYKRRIKSIKMTSSKSSRNSQLKASSRIDGRNCPSIGKASPQCSIAHDWAVEKSKGWASEARNEKMGAEWRGLGAWPLRNRYGWHPGLSHWPNPTSLGVLPLQRRELPGEVVMISNAP